MNFSKILFLVRSREKTKLFEGCLVRLTTLVQNIIKDGFPLRCRVEKRVLEINYFGVFELKNKNERSKLECKKKRNA